MKRRLIKSMLALSLSVAVLVSDGTLVTYAMDALEGEIDIETIDEADAVEETGDIEAEVLEDTQTLGLAMDYSDKYGVIATGNCGVHTGETYGDNLTYELYKAEDGTVTLTILGSGEMGDNCYTIWKALYKEVKVGFWNLVLNEGITSIGNYAFGGPSSTDSCTYIFKGTLDIPDSVTSIGTRAFYGLTFLTSELIIPEYVETIGSEAFAGCTGFAALPMNIPESVKIIGARAFCSCKFPSYYLPEYIELLGNSSSSDYFPFPIKVDGKAVTLIAIKETYAYNWADENQKYGYILDVGQRKFRIYYDVCCTDGEVDPKIGIAYEERPLGDLAVPERPGYSFLGWFDLEDGGTEITAQDICVGEIFAYAHWQANDYEVSFDAQSGKGNLTPRTVTYDMPYNALPEVTRTNYDFTGWYTEADGGIKVEEDSPVKIPDNHTLYAHWLGIPMTVSFDTLEGVGTADDMTVYYDSPYGTLPTVTKENCEFLGWYTQKSGGTLITADSKVENLEDHTLYAHWQGVEMKVYFEAEGGQGYLPSITVMYGSTYGPLPTVTRDDKDFDGWYTAKEGGEKVTSETIVSKTDIHNLYAHWKHKHVNVSFNPNGGDSIHPKISVECEMPYGELPVPTKYGYDFAGWFTSGTGGFEITSASIVEEKTSHTLYAHWTPKTGIKVSFDPAPGTVTADDLYVTYDSAYAKGSSLPIPVRPSYEFAGWYTQSNGGKRVDPDSIVSIEEDHFLYARWRGKALTVTFDTGEIAGLKETKTVYYDDYYGGMPTPVIYGRKFEGWYTEPADGEKIEATTKVTITENQTLYAHYSNKICLITYELDGGSNNPENPITYTMSENTIKLKDPYKLGYKFAGWYVGPKKSSKEKITQISKGMAEDITLYAKWTVNTYKITYVMGISAGNPNSKKTTYRVCDHNTAITKYAFKSPSKKGYVFLGWYLDPDFTEQIEYIDGTFEGNIKLYAKWRGATYYLRYNADDAIAGSVTPTMHQYRNPDSTVSLGEGFIKEGYHVGRWYFKKNLSGNYLKAGTNINNVCTEEGETVDVYAYFVANNYYVQYDGNGATKGKMNKRKYTFNKESGISQNAFRKTGYVFANWNTEPDGSGTVYKEGQKVKGLTTYNEETVTLYAQWKPITYTVEFSPGSLGEGKMSNIKATYDDISTLPSNSFVRNGFTFKNWRTATKVNSVYLEFEDCETAVLNACTSNKGTVKLKAMWEYTITFDPNCIDYTGNMENVTFDADKAFHLPANQFEREGYTFVGWVKSPTAKSKWKADKASVRNVKNITLYALWKAK